MAAVEKDGFQVVVGRKKQGNLRAPIKLTPAIPKVVMGSMGTGSQVLDAEVTKNPMKISRAGVCSANGGYCLARDDLKMGEYVALEMDVDGEIYVIADEEEVEKNIKYWSSSVLLVEIRAQLQWNSNNYVSDQIQL